MKERILMWLFGTDDIPHYMELLEKSFNHSEECLKLLDDHNKTLERAKWELDTIRKLIRICENHGIDVDEEIKHVQLDEVNANEALD